MSRRACNTDHADALAWPSSVLARAEIEVLDMEHHLVKQRSHVIVVQRIDDLTPLPLSNHQPHATQDTQLMEDRRLSHPHRTHELPHRARPMPQATEDLHPTRN